jgi:modulator of FtsH protease
VLAAAVTEGWSDLFVAVAGASAALAGLVFVAVSINVERILGYPGLPERGLVTVLLLIGVLVVALVALVPDQSRTALGAELLGVTLALVAAVGTLTLVPRERSHRGGALLVALAGSVPLAAGAVVVLAGGGLGVLLVAIVATLLGAVLNAWVLLVEILR